MTETPQPKLTRRQRLFIDHYLQCWNGAEAARRAGYISKSNVIGSQLLANPSISAQIQERLNEVHMSADEALKLMSDIARGDIADVMDITPMGYVVDMAKAKERGVSRQIKRIKQKTVIISGKDGDQEIHTTEVELYDAQAAQRDVLKLAGRFIERHDLTSGGQPIFRVIHDDEPRVTDPSGGQLPPEADGSNPE